MALGVGPQWGQVLQEPNIAIDAGGAGRRRQLWMERQGTMGTAQQSALDQLTAALTGERDAQYAADVAKMQAAAAARAGRGSKGGSGGTGMMVPAPPVQQQPWVDQYLAGIPSTPPPAYDGSIYPSTKFGPNNVYATLTKAPSPYAAPSFPSRAMSVAHPAGARTPQTMLQAPTPTPTRYAPSRLS